MCVRVGIGDPIWRESAPPSCEGWPEYNFQFSVRVGLNAVVATCDKPSQAAEPASCYGQRAVSQANILLEIPPQGNHPSL